MNEHATTLAIPDQGLDGLRIQAEIETADRAKTKRPTWAPAVALDGELLELCHEIEYLSPDDKPVARLWAVFADPKHRGTIIREKFSTHPLSGMACRGFELRAGQQHNGGRMARAFMDEDGRWSTALRWGRGLGLKELRHNVEVYQRRINASPERLEPQERPTPQSTSRATTFEEAIEFYSSRGDLSEEFKQHFAKGDVERFQRAIKNWEEREQRIRDPQFIQSVEDDLNEARDDLAKTLRRIAKVEIRPDWYFVTHTRMTELATARILEFAGDLEPQRRKGSLITGCCFCCGRHLEDPVSIERGVGPECVQSIRTFDLRDLVRLKTEMVAAHPDKGGTNEAFREAFAKYEAAKEAAQQSLTYQS